LSQNPPINGLSPGLLTNNPNLASPFRIDRATASMVGLCVGNHTYTAVSY